MSRIAKEPVELPQGVEFKQEGNVVTIKGGKGSLSLELHALLRRVEQLERHLAELESQPDRLARSQHAQEREG